MSEADDLATPNLHAFTQYSHVFLPLLHELNANVDLAAVAVELALISTDDDPIMDAQVRLMAGSANWLNGLMQHIAAIRDELDELRAA